MRKLSSEIVEGLIWITIACVAFVLTYKFNDPLAHYRYGASGWPRTLILGIVIFALINALWSVFLSRRPRAVDAGEAPFSDTPPSHPTTGVSVYVKHLGSFAVPLLYLFLMPRAGFYILTPFFIAGYMVLLGEQRWVHVLGTTLLIYGLSLTVFVKLLYVPLPVGNWPGFYDINSFFVALIK
jgi:hypothetical protein